MITAYRLFNSIHASGWNSGEGAFKYGGRWNSKGFRVLYASASLALATLEVLVNLDDEEVLEDYAYAAIQFPESSVTDIREIAEIPANWNDYPAPEAVRKLGDQWIVDKTSLVLSAPSAVIATEQNFLINLRHPEISAIEFGIVGQFVFDRRFVKKNR
jgi:RES domain-containing protein